LSISTEPLIEKIDESSLSWSDGNSLEGEAEPAVEHFLCVRATGSMNAVAVAIIKRSVSPWYRKDRRLSLFVEFPPCSWPKERL